MPKKTPEERLWNWLDNRQRFDDWNVKYTNATPRQIYDYVMKNFKPKKK